MSTFHGTPVFHTGQAEPNPHLIAVGADGVGAEADGGAIREGLAGNRLVLLRGLTLERAAGVFGELVDHYGLRDSYDVQMQHVVHWMAAREAVGEVAVTVNKRGPYQMIQPHSEGDSSSPLELFGLYCVQNAASGGESILGLVNGAADHSTLRAKEKAVLDRGLSGAELNKLRRNHMDAKDVIPDGSPVSRVLVDTPRGAIVVRAVPVKPETSVISGESVVTYWDNVTVHDHAFHRYHYALLNQLGLFHSAAGLDGYEAYMHIEEDTAWSPADTDSGDLARTSGLFQCHVVHKMAAGELLLFNNRAWTHAANNWPPDQIRTLHAMYA